MPGRLEFEFGFRNPAAPRKPRHGDTMRIVVMGDFSGRVDHNTASVDIDKQPLVPVDIDTFDDVLRRISPCLTLPDNDNEGMTIRFSQLDDFHPDALLRNAERFQALLEIRRRLLNPTTFAQAAAELRRHAPAPSETPKTDTANDPTPAAEENQTSMFERLLGGSAVETANDDHTRRSPANLDQFINDIVAPYIVTTPDDSQALYVAAVDDALGDQLRSLLHHPDVQALEAAWRSIYWLVTRWDSDAAPKLFLLDISKHELAEHIAAAKGDLENSGLYKRLVDDGAGTLGGEAWSLIIGDYDFSANADDLALLGALGAIASQAGGPFLAAAQPSIIGCRSLAQSPDMKDWHREDDEAVACWQALRQSDIAPWIGLALPRFLLRLPYGKHAEPVEQLDFEELKPGHDHEAYLWGNPAFACALLLGMAFEARGGSMAPGDVLEIDDLPFHVYEENGEKTAKACAEIYLTERAAEAMLNMGLMPLVSYRNRNAARVLRFQSIAEPAGALAGAWN